MALSWNRAPDLVKFSRRLSSAAHKTKILSEPWVGVIGLEVHAQINSRSKLFCRSPVAHAAAANSCVGVFESAHPGTLPVLNRKCVEAAVLTALALEARINPVSYFDRKHYFYPDMPAGYQITQQRVPVAQHGQLRFVAAAADGKPCVHTAHLLQLQIEEDSGKSLHDTTHNRVFVDLNRAGVGLLELVFSPCLHSGEQAAGLVRQLAYTLKRLGVCTAKMNEGALRVDANVSVHQTGQPLGTRTEVKNINSIKFLTSAIEFELSRQVAVLEGGGQVVNETRNYDSNTGQTVSMRDKEGLQDYRFLPEPNLPPLRVYNSSRGDPPPPASAGDALDVSVLQQKLPPLPVITDETLHTLVHDCNLRTSSAQLILRDPELHQFYLHGVREHEQSATASEAGAGCEVSPDTHALAAQLLLYCVRDLLPQGDRSLHTCGLKLGYLWTVARLQQSNRITPEHGKAVFDRIILNGDNRDPMQIASAENWIIQTDLAEVQRAISTVVAEHLEFVAKYKKTRLNPKKQQRPLNQLRIRTCLLLNENVDKAIVEEQLRITLDEIISRDDQPS